MPIGPQGPSASTPSFPLISVLPLDEDDELPNVKTHSFDLITWLKTFDFPTTF